VTVPASFGEVSRALVNSAGEIAYPTRSYTLAYQVVLDPEHAY
jgi:hypothetical protein